VNATAAPVNYTVEVHAVSANLCEADTAFTVSVLPEPTAAIVLGSTASCEVPVELEVTNASTGAIASTWWFNGNLVSAMNQPTVTATQAGTQALVLEAMNGWGCTDLDTAYFTVYDQPVAALNVFPLTGCQILPVTFENQSVGATASQLTLTGPSGVLFDGPLDGTATLDLAEAGLHTAAFVATSADGCQVGLDVPQLIQVYPTPTAGFEATPLIGTADQIDPLNDTWAFESTATGATIWNWNFGDGFVGGGETTQHTYPGAGEFLVTLTAANAFGCMAQQAGWVRLDQLLQVFVPNAFTPPSLLNQQAGTGSRGLNDAFRPVFSDLDLVAEYELTIVNRWGEVVFHSFDPAEYWEGEAVANGDHYAPDDTYVWTLYYQPTYEDIGVRQVGHVTLIRD
jgi:PKD repeat protein